MAAVFVNSANLERLLPTLKSGYTPADFSETLEGNDVLECVLAPGEGPIAITSFFTRFSRVLSASTAGSTSHDYAMASNSFLQHTALAAFVRHLHHTILPVLDRAISQSLQASQNSPGAKSSSDLLDILRTAACKPQQPTFIPSNTAATFFHQIFTQEDSPPNNSNHSIKLVFSPDDKSLKVIKDVTSERKRENSWAVTLAARMRDGLEHLMAAVYFFPKKQDGDEVYRRYSSVKKLGRLGNFALEAFQSPLPFLDSRFTQLLDRPTLHNHL
ncbi:hypothetical protein P7C70_g9620, partial [Phenoliferia sp. Uapishka_3]